MFNCIILEGPDASGKSTLATRLSDQLQCPVQHTGGPPPNKDEFDNRLIDLALNTGPRIYDRHPAISEQIYGPLHHGNSYLTFQESCNILKSYKPLIIYCRPHQYIMLSKLDPELRDHKDQTQWDLVVKHHTEIISRYDQWMNEFKEQFIVSDFNYENQDLSCVV